MTGQDQDAPRRADLQVQAGSAGLLNGLLEAGIVQHRAERVRIRVADRGRQELAAAGIRPGRVWCVHPVDEPGHAIAQRVLARHQQPPALFERLK